MIDHTPVDRLYSEAIAVLQILDPAAEPSLSPAAANHFRKALLLAAASYFEQRICEHLLAFVRERAGGSILVESFVQNKAIARQYHTWFVWERANANQFFGLFGSEFRTAMTAQISVSDELQSSVKAFLEIGNHRNRLVHQNYATFPMEKTLEEIYSLYCQALRFVEMIPAALRNLTGRSLGMAIQ